MRLTRDDLKLFVTTIGGVLTALAVNIHQFAWLSEQTQYWIGLGALVASVISAQFSTSPLRGKQDSISEGMSRSISSGDKS